MPRIRLCVLLILDAIIAVISEDTNYQSKYEFGTEDDRFDSRKEPQGVTMSEEKRLIKKVLGDYKEVGKVGRPVFNTSETVRVSYGLALIQILDLDEKNQVLTTNVWSRYSWHDNFLKWDPAEYIGNIKEVRVPIDTIWTPDIVLYNYADERLKEHRDAYAIVNYDGNIMWIPRGIFKSTCSIDIRYFPFDIQECRMKFGSWTYDGFKLNIDFYEGLEEVDIKEYVESNEWILLAHPAVKNVKFYPCCAEPYPDLTFAFKLKRSAAFYNYILILPCVLLSLLTLVVFWLPPESSAKMILGMNIFVAFFLLLRILADCTPPASHSIPLIGAYFCLNLVLITLSTFLSVIIINLYFRSDKRNRVPLWLRKFLVEFIGGFLCLKGELGLGKRGEQMIVIDSPDGRQKLKKRIKCPEMKYNKFQPPPGTSDNNKGTCNGTIVMESPIHQKGALENEVKEIRRALRAFNNKLYEKDVTTKISKEWRAVALVMDRIFFFIYLFIILFGLGYYYPS